MNQSETKLLVFGLFGAVALWMFSRTKTGTQVIQSTASSVATTVTGAGDWLLSKIRGIRNNNPGNIVRTSDVWEGEAADQSSDARFVVFDAPQWGIRALARVMRSHYDEGATTLAQLVTRWAPPPENDPASYIAAMVQFTGMDPNAQIDSIDDVMPLLVPAVIHQENGIQPYPDDLIATGINLETTA